MADSKKPTKRQIAAAFAQAKIESMGTSIPEAPRAEYIDTSEIEVMPDDLPAEKEHCYKAGFADGIQHALASQPAGEPVAHIFPDDLHRLKTTECSVNAYSVEMMAPDKPNTVPLFEGPQPAVPDVKALALHIRKVGSIGASALAESICNWIAEGGR